MADDELLVPSGTDVEAALVSAVPGLALDASLVSALPGLARVAAGSWMRIVRWSVETTTTAGSDILRAVSSGASPTQAVADAAAQVRAAVREALGIDAGPSSPRASGPSPTGSTREELRARGAALLYDSADVWFEEDTHPAYARILDELSPDEARILRFLATKGPQPSIDIRTNRPLGVGSEVVASGLSMIGLQAGVRVLDRTRADLNNLFRLGMIWFSREQVADPTRYQVVEVQPDVLDALKRAGRSPKIVHRSIQMTPFGEDFCAECLPLGGRGAAEPPAGPGATAP